MPKADNTHTTRPLGRRSLASGGAALLTLTGCAAVASPPSPDAELLQRCDAYLREGLRVLSSSSEDCGGDLAVARARYQRDVKDGIANAETLHQVAALPAHTAEGMRAKAVIVRLHYLQAHPRAGAALTWPATPEQQVIWSLVNDLVGRV